MGTPGTVVRTSLPDGHYYYGRVLEGVWLAFYDLRTVEPVDDLDRIVARPVLFVLAVHDDLLAPGEWATLGVVPLDGSLRPPRWHFIQDLVDPALCRLIDLAGHIRAATHEECVGLEPAAVWEPEHIAERLTDHYAGRPNVWVESLRLRPT
ncbi:hypothetical protein Ais01nite_04420 [Asanoa ishikariensis]|uniref:Immunity protein 26 n=1 Tax=Asanoa ishikariensis TaxID=137265 RepID=A0A1H3TIT8_9ACTN|nr:immunity 26/phosphotriesterase HocA family protein [Asanoa ishikariensis]GIF62407.1 hypothetical protein Ais01nite_04420 [Asanoa ishikariensis]SDZ49788.1 Immunity protein 26 [Asanoa ishikariensis]